MSHIAIVGAGAAGLATAWKLRTSSHTVTVFEKSRGYSGRAATRRRKGLCYDHGANYFKMHTPELERLIRDQLPSGELVTIDRDVWTFDATGRVQSGDPEANASTKWTYRKGINTIGKLLAAASSATIQLQTRVDRLEQRSGGWTVLDTDQVARGTFDAVVLTPPAPQTHDLIAASSVDGALHEALLDDLSTVRYTSQFTIVLGYEHEIHRPGDFYALLNTDGAHPVAWLSFEEDKPGHIPDGQSVLIVQMAPDWTDDHFEAPEAQLARAAATQASALLDVDCCDPAWFDTQRWRYALPQSAATLDALRRGEKAGLFVAGDALVGKGRVNRAIETGLRCGERVDAFLG